MAGAPDVLDVPAVIAPVEPLLPREIGYADWRRRLRHNLSRPGDGRWDPLTYLDETAPP